jgi:hypothetical protein
VGFWRRRNLLPPQLEVRQAPMTVDDPALYRSVIFHICQ